MKRGAKIGIVSAGVIGLGLWIWTKVSQAKNFAQSLVVTPMWYGKPKDMKVSMQGVRCPLAVDFGNRSDLALKVKVNSLDVVNSAGNTIAYNDSTGTDTIEIPANGTGRMPIDVWIPISTLAKVISSAVSSIIAGDVSVIQDECYKLIDGCTIKVGITINGLVNANLDVVLNESKEVNVDGEKVSGLGLVCAQDRKIGSRKDYQHLIPSESNLNRNDQIIINDVTPEQTAMKIREFAVKYKSDTTDLAYALERDNLKDTIQSIYDFVCAYIKYTEDSPNNEQLRRPLRTLYDQKGDCDCYSCLVASICENLGLSYKVRIAEYDNKGYYQHVYIVIEGYVCDPVIDACFKEKKTTKRKDF